MLPDALDLENNKSKRDYISLLTLLANADGQLVREEMAALESRMGHALLHPDSRSELRQLLKHPPEIDELIDNSSESTLRLVLRDGALLSACDGKYHEDELTVIDKLVKAIGISDDELVELFDWVTEGWEWMARGRRLIDMEIPGDKELLGE